MIDLRGAKKLRIHLDVLLPIETDMSKRRFYELLHGVRHAGRDDVVVSLRLLQHQPHRADVVTGKAPVAAGVAITERQVIGQTKLDARHAVADLAGHELEPAPR